MFWPETGMVEVVVERYIYTWRYRCDVAPPHKTSGDIFSHLAPLLPAPEPRAGTWWQLTAVQILADHVRGVQSFQLEGRAFNSLPTGYAMSV
jgi:hypothetical protein